MIVVITGTPGTGKSSVASELSKLTGWPSFNVGKIARQRKLTCGYDRIRKVPIADIGKLKRRLAGELAANAIVEGHYAADVCKPDCIFVLRCHPRTLRARLKRRGYSGKKIEENVLCEMLDYCTIDAALKAKRVFELETAGMRAKQVAILIKQVLDGKAKLKRGPDYSRLL